ncbi:glycosyltransferase family 4 protein [Pontivivens insulae]|uniref:GDP-mannose-dependent alpha-(1-6)-phosphatidylinositol monomannoside mannosyltransferase n=1 Tax=Pontivivens insulae TaxID=1639689 RepID=A0A2R8ADP2_9RHOB|nr:glycosyltransferase family 4 protein [Pontivivens insulae]RED14116.1 glycosyltransferase involved in cell wall biosynthesis [Pontivivens insulae]SPF30190.1 GDP-mannose-dependent alpha-(1-6)-phosphatidylinositol monomannoside mannosyltransferase [Pontivivens insulae]
MNYLFVHQNAPAQFRYIAPQLAQDPGNRVVYITLENKPVPAGVAPVRYKLHRSAGKETHHYLRRTEEAVLYGQAVARKAFDLRSQGFNPDVMIGHPGWGETLYLKDIWPNAKLISYCEFYYRSRGSDFGFDKEFPDQVDAVFANRTKNAQHLLALEAADALYAPTDWQARQFPAPYQPLIHRIHDGINCALVRPDPDAQYTTRSGRTFKVGDPVITYVSRYLEPYRGFHQFMRALPRTLADNPDAHVVLVGAETGGYGRKPAENQTWKQRILAEIGPLPQDRVHFEDRVPYGNYLKLLQVSAVHPYLTYPFVLSWSCLEAMAAGCVIVGSNTAPVQEVIDDGAQGVLTDFFDPEALSSKLSDVLQNPGRYAGMRVAARERVLERFELQKCLARLTDLIRTTAQG